MAYVINEETAKLIGGTDGYQALIGKVISVYGDKGKIVGVVKTFSMNSLYSPIEPVVIRLDRIEVGVWVFVLAGLGAVLIALLTVSWQSVKAAVSNPVNSLKNE
jgi:hypothetical protein